MLGPISRIILRLLVGILVGKAIFSAEDGNALSSDPEIAALIEMALAGAIWAGTEGWYWLAKRLGWAT